MHERHNTDLLTLTPATLISARVAGVAYLANIGLGLFGELFVRGSLVVAGDAGATASNILASPLLWRTGIATDLLMQLLDLPLIVFFYYLLKPVSHPLALLATAINLIQTAVLAANKLTLVAALSLLNSSTNAPMPSELHAQALLAINLHGYGFGIGLIFFGFSCLVRGYLMFLSTYVPRILGGLLVIAGVSYLVNSFALLLSPSFAALLFPMVLFPALAAELALSIWLLFANNTVLQQRLARARPVETST